MTIRNLITKIMLPVFLLQSGLTSVAAAQDFNPDPDWKITADLWMTSLDGGGGNKINPSSVQPLMFCPVPVYRWSS
jgi:hypothetical protein